MTEKHDWIYDPVHESLILRRGEIFWIGNPPKPDLRITEFIFQLDWPVRKELEKFLGVDLAPPSLRAEGPPDDPEDAKGE